MTISNSVDRSKKKEGTIMILLVASNRDIASLNISRQILNNYPFQQSAEEFHGNPVYKANINDRHVELVTLNEESVQAQSLTDCFPKVELMIFVSRHSSIKGTPTLSVHTPGNLGEAELGGIAKRVSFAPANAMRNALIVMQQFRNEMKLAYEVSYECTHHGPSLNVPAMFAELGSSIEQWKDQKGAEVVAHAAMRSISTFNPSAAPAVLGIGGPHYNAKFTRLALESNLAFGHIIPKYALGSIDVETIRQCVKRTMEEVECAVLDWKGIKGEDRPRIIQMLSSVFDVQKDLTSACKKRFCQVSVSWCSMSTFICWQF
jgi:D-aminoacyl-tRNA deacylase